jgi:hypothetical protein
MFKRGLDMKKYLVRISLSIFLLLVMSIGLCAKSKIILYSGSLANVNFQMYSVPVKAGLVIVDKLPIGIIPSTIQVLDPDIESWNYYYDLENQETLYKRLIGKQVKIGTDKNAKTMKFLKKNGDDFVFKTKGRVVLNPKGEWSLPTEEFAYYPCLKMNTKSRSDSKTDVMLSYFINTLESNIQYKAEYNDKTEYLELTSLVYIKNTSGKKFEDVNLEVIAGSPQLKREGRANLMSLKASGISVEKLDDYYKYRIPGLFDIESNSVMAIPLFEGKRLKAKKIYRYSPNPYFISKNGETKSEQVDILLEIKNKTGFPLAAGKIKIFSRKEFVGEDHLSAFPRGYKKIIKYGKAFDIIGQRSRVGSKRFSNKENRETYRIFLTNLKNTPINVEIFETIHGANWKIVSTSIPYSKMSANKVKFVVSIMPSKTEEIKYTVEKSHGI